MSYIDSKYAELTRTYLRNFKKKSARLFNFSCWYCGDSETNTRKARGYLIENKGKFFYYCHNCGKSTTLKYFLKDLDYGMYQEYVKESLVDHDNIKITADILEPEPVHTNLNALDTLPTINSLDQHHHARQWLDRRKIPSKWYNDLRYTDNFRGFTNSVFPGKFEYVGKSDARVVIPFFKPGGTLFGFQGRALYTTELRYITIMLDEDQPKLWNWDKCDFNKPYFITEGPFDAMFLSNACAMAGADFHSMDADNAIIVYDNEPRNVEIIKKYEKKIDEYYRVCIWPDYIEQKDINDMVLVGLNPEEIIWENLYRGLSAKVKLNEWRKVHEI